MVGDWSLLGHRRRFGFGALLLHDLAEFQHGRNSQLPRHAHFRQLRDGVHQSRNGGHVLELGSICIGRLLGGFCHWHGIGLDERKNQHAYATFVLCLVDRAFDHSEHFVHHCLDHVGQSKNWIAQYSGHVLVWPRVAALQHLLHVGHDLGGWPALLAHGIFAHVFRLQGHGPVP